MVWTLYHRYGTVVPNTVVTRFHLGLYPYCQKEPDQGTESLTKESVGAPGVSIGTEEREWGVSLRYRGPGNVESIRVRHR